MLRLTVDQKTTTGARGLEVSQKKKALRPWFRKFSFKCMSVSQK